MLTANAASVSKVHWYWLASSMNEGAVYGEVCGFRAAAMAAN
jgi:hypothetical protein